MTVLIHQHAETVRGTDGKLYRASVCGTARPGDTWSAWIEFEATDPSRRRLRTGQETSQPDRAAVEYWAAGLEPIYYEGALSRAVLAEPA